MRRHPFWFDSTLDLLAAALGLALPIGAVLIVVGTIRLWRHHHGTNRPDNEVRKTR